MKFPKHLRLSDVSIPIQYVERHQLDDGAPTFGVYRNATQGNSRRIRVFHGQTPSDDRDTLLHEVLHACADLSANELTKEQEEYFISSVAPWLLVALRQNPKLVEFLTEPSTTP